MVKKNWRKQAEQKSERTLSNYSHWFQTVPNNVVVLPASFIVHSDIIVEDVIIIMLAEFRISNSNSSKQCCFLPTSFIVHSNIIVQDVIIVMLAEFPYLQLEQFQTMSLCFTGIFHRSQQYHC